MKMIRKMSSTTKQKKFSTIVLRILALCICYSAFFTVEVDGLCAAVQFCDTCSTVVGQCAKCNAGYGLDATKQCDRCSDVITGCTACNSTVPPTCTACSPANTTVGLDGTCKACAPNCRTCTRAGPAKCDSCSSGYRLVAASQTCEVCQTTNCATCPTSATVCTNCATGYALIAATGQCSKCDDHCTFCVTAPPTCSASFCESRYGFNTVSRKCELCAANCTRCDTNQPPNCDVGRCDSGLTLDPITKKCVPCGGNCSICEIAGPGKCDTCKTGFTKQADGTCSNACTTIENCLECFAGRCSKCKDNFGTINAGNQSSCTLCTTKPNCLACTNLATCTRCAFTTMGPVRNGTGGCDLCAANCRSCTTAGAGRCDFCNTGYVVITATGQCRKCTDSNCQFCDPVSLKCITCSTGYSLDAATSTCLPCTSNCAFCNQNPGKCDVGFCVNGSTYDAATKLCNLACNALPNCVSCPQGANGTCEQCLRSPFFGLRADKRGCQDCALQSGCDQCQTVTACTVCKSVTQVPSTSGDGTCSGSASNTSVTVTASSNTSVTVGQTVATQTGGTVALVTAGSTAAQATPGGPTAPVTAGVTGGVGGTTVAAVMGSVPTGSPGCGGACAVCTPTSCSKCISTDFAPKNDGTSNCAACALNCRACQVPGKCDICKSGYYVLPDGTCKACTTGNCQICAGDVCSICMSGYYLDSATKSCLPCGANCTFCNLNVGTCDPGFCATGYGFVATDTSGAKNVCKKCGMWCLNCDINGPNNCDPGQCKDGYTFDPTTKQCTNSGVTQPPGVTTLPSSVCQKLPFCAQCSTIVASNTTVCDRCVDTPYYGFRPDMDGCEECLTRKGCFTCTNITMCKTCSSSFEWPVQDGSGECAACASNCNKCTVNGGKKCDSDGCKAPYTINFALMICELSNGTVTSAGPGVTSAAGPPAGVTTAPGQPTGGPGPVSTTTTPATTTSTTTTPTTTTPTTTTPTTTTPTTTRPGVTVSVGPGTQGSGLTDTQKIIIAVAASIGGVLASLLLGCCVYQLCCTPLASGATVGAASPASYAPTRTIVRPVYIPQPRPRVTVARPIYAKAAPGRPMFSAPSAFAPRANYYPGGIYGGGFM